MATAPNHGARRAGRKTATASSSSWPRRLAVRVDRRVLLARLRAAGLACRSGVSVPDDPPLVLYLFLLFLLYTPSIPI